MIVPSVKILDCQPFEVGNDRDRERLQDLGWITCAQADDLRSRIGRRADTVEGILEDQAICGFLIQVLCRQPITHRVGFAAGDTIGGDDRIEQVTNAQQAISPFHLSVFRAGHETGLDPVVPQ